MLKSWMLGNTECAALMYSLVFVLFHSCAANAGRLMKEADSVGP
jgi:hypothetical protein